MAPFLSIVIPAYNEAAGIAGTLDTCVTFLSSWAPSWELLVVDDGSTDGTAAIVATAAARQPHIRLVQAAHAGKGAAVKRGMIEARGEWRFLADADLSMDIAQLPRFFDGPGNAPPAEIVIGSREVTGAVRLDEPWSRHAIGRGFNWIARLVAVPGIQDTQCGFKLFSRSAAERLYPRLTLEGFAFDVELLFLARRAGFRVVEIPVTWQYVPGSRVCLGNGLAAFLGIARVRMNAWRGRYAARPWPDVVA